MNNADKPISPIFSSDGFPIGATDTKQGELIGLSKREYFAAMAMQGLLARTPDRHETDLGILEAQRIAQEAVIMSHKLLAELDKSK